MGSVTLRTIKAHTDGYCSQARIALPPIRTIEEGVRVIEKILRKKILCRHDVQDLNKAYGTIDLLERKAIIIPKECNSQTALEKIIERIKTFIAVNTAEGLISLYHLRSFSYEELPVNQCFNNQLRHPLSLFYGKKLDREMEIASSLPCCHSEAQFDQDVATLIGPNRSPEVTKVLNQKRAKLQQHERTKQAIRERKLDLNSRKERDSQKYLGYFDELLSCGYIYLYDHLIRMKDLPTHHEQRASIKQMSFSNLAHVILEVREAIIQKVENSIPVDRKNVLFLVGNTRSGKSTAFCFLRGDQMVLKGDHYESLSDKSGLIGHNEADSCTFLPNTEVTDNWVIVDFPGFSNNQPISLGIELALKALVKKYQPKIIVLEAITSTDGRFADAARLGRRLSRLLANKENCVLGITKYSIKGSFRAFQERQDELLEQTGLEKIVQFYNLEDPEYSFSCHEVFSNPYIMEKKSSRSTTRASVHELFDSDDEEISQRFEANLLDEVEALDFSTHSSNFQAFEESIFESSLINTVFSVSNPEIGQLFHLPEMDPDVVRTYDKKIVRVFIKNYKEFIVKNLNISLIKKILKEAEGKVSQDKVDILRKRLNELIVLMRLAHVGLIYDEVLAQRQWEDIQRSNSAIVENNCLEPFNRATLKMTSLIKSYSLKTMLDLVNQHINPKKIAFESIIEFMCNDLTEMKNLFFRLTHIEKIISKRESLIQALTSAVISSESIEALRASIQEKIDKVRDIYGDEDWDQRVTCLDEEFAPYFYSLRSLSRDDNTHISFVLAFARKLMKPTNSVPRDHERKEGEQTSKLEHVLICFESSIEGDCETYVIENHIVFKDLKELSEIKIPSVNACTLKNFIVDAELLIEKTFSNLKNELNSQLISIMLAATILKRFEERPLAFRRQ